MKIYRASYILNYGMNGGLLDWFEFEQYKDDKWEKRVYGYFHSDGWAITRAKDGVILDGLCLIGSEKYFESELSEDELHDLEVKMREECIVALKEKKERMIKSLEKQIEFIGRKEEKR